MYVKSLIALILLAGAVTTNSTSAQQAPAAETMTIAALGERIRQSESGVTARLRAFRPIVEVYSQYVTAHDKLGTVPIQDEYFLGQFDWSDQEGPKLKRLTPEKGARGGQLKSERFAVLTVPDWRWLNDQRYEFKFLRREFLGEVRCLVLDVQPRLNRGDGFTGRIWVEDRDFNIVRFNGTTRSLPAGKNWINVDSWRANVFPGMWLPSYIYAELQSDDPRDGPRIKSQVRIWGYELKNVRPMQELATIQIDAAVSDGNEQPQQLSTTLSRRMWDQQAEENVLDRLAKAGLLAPPSDVDQVLETVVRNLQITNNLPIAPVVRARILLTSPLESFTVGRTIVLSRGLIDVLPDEASLAMMLSHELAHIVLGHRVIDSKFAFADQLMVPDDELVTTVRYQHSMREEQAADAQVIELLNKSPYKDKLADAGLFLRLLAENSTKLKNLIQPHIGEHMSGEGQLRRLTELIQKSPKLSAESLDQIAALPLGGRVTVDPWTSRVRLLRAPTVQLTSAREKSSLAVTPLVPLLRYVEPRP